MFSENKNQIIKYNKTTHEIQFFKTAEFSSNEFDVCNACINCVQRRQQFKHNRQYQNRCNSKWYSDDNTLLGAGSTFIYPFFSKVFSVYNQQTGLKVNYQSIGSGGGILQLTNKTVDFGDSDAPLNDEQDSKIGVPVLHIPMCSGAVALSYNLPDVKDTLKLTPAVLAKFFLGKLQNGTMQQLLQLIKVLNFLICQL